MFSRSRKTNDQALFLKNLDLLAYENPSNFPTDSKPTIQIAEEQLRSKLVRSADGKQHSLLCDLQEFKQYGPGLYLLFKLIKFIGLVLLILFPLMLVNIILITDSGKPVNETNFETVLQSTTISELDYPIVSRTIDAFVVFSIALGLAYWRWKKPRMIQQCRKEVSLPSYCTVIMKPIPNFYSQKWLKEFAQTHYGPVHSIYTAKNYHQDLHHYKQLRQAVQVFREQRQFYIKNKNTESIQPLCERFLHLRKLYHLLTDTVNDQKIYEPYCVFLTFQYPSSKRKILSSSTSPFNWLPCFNQLLLQQDGLQKPSFKSCRMQPDGVTWENLNLSKTEKFLRCGLVFLVLSLFLFIAVTIIFILVAVESGLYVDEYDNLTLKQILMTRSEEALESYCMELSYSNFKATSECKNFSQNYKVYFVMFFMLPIVVTFFKMIFISIMKKLVTVRRHKDGFQKMEWQIVIISLFYFIKAALIPLLIYRSFDVFGFKFDLLHMYLPLLSALKSVIKIKAQLIHSYPSFSAQWVSHASHNVIIIGIISFNFTILYHFVVDFLKGFIHKKQAQAMRTQHRMNKKLLGQQFQIEMIYSQIGGLILFLGVYLSCMPIVYPLVLFSIVILYWSSKYTFIRLCKRPLIYAHGITDITVNILYISLLLHCVLSPQYFSDRTEETAQRHWVQNMVDKWQNLALIIFIIGTYFFGNPIVNIILTFYSRMSQNQQPEQSKSKIPAEALFKPNRIQSYSMHENQQYENILQTLFIVNKIEINRIGYFNHHTLNQLKEEINKPPKDFLLFQELLTSLLKECNALKEENKLKGSKQQISLALLMEISRNADQEVNALNHEREIKLTVKNKILSIQELKHQNLSDISANKSKQGSILNKSKEVQLQPDPETQIRLH